MKRALQNKHKKWYQTMKWSAVFIMSVGMVLVGIVVYIQSLYLDYKVAKSTQQLYLEQVVPIMQQNTELKKQLSKKITLDKQQEAARSAKPKITYSSKWEEFKAAARKVASIYAYPSKVIIAQGALESAKGTSFFCVQRNNCLGIGAFDNNPGNAHYFQSMEHSIVAYIDLIKRNFPEAWANRNNADLVVRYLKHNTRGVQYATDPSYEAKVMSMEDYK